MREIVLDTYYGEGPLNTAEEDWPGFEHIYFKVAEGAYGYLDAGNDVIREVTRQIALESKKFKTIGVYQYMRRHDEIHYLAQAETILRQVEILKEMGVPVHYIVIDLESANNLDPDGNFPSKFGYWAYMIWAYVKERTDIPILIYSNPYHYVEIFRWHGYTWADAVPWIVAQYPDAHWNEMVWEQAVSGERSPNTYPANRPAVMWQVTDKFPADDWMPQSSAADVNVWLVDHRQVLGLTGIDTVASGGKRPRLVPRVLRAGLYRLLNRRVTL